MMQRPSVLALSRLKPLRSGRAAPSGATRSALAAFGRRRTRRFKDVFTRQTRLRLTSFSHQFALSRPGGYGGVAAPVPIPNTAVKRPSANGTSS